MRPQKSPKQGSVEIPVGIEEACPESLAQASVIGATVSEAARPSRAEPDTTAQPRLSAPDRQQLISAMIIASNSSRP
jgi:hypothetical protein